MLDSFKARWNLLQSINPLFSPARLRPNLAEADSFALQGEILILQIDLKLAAYEQYLVDVNQLMIDDVRLDIDVSTLLQHLEELIDHQILNLSEQKPSAEVEFLSNFPRLVALRDCYDYGGEVPPFNNLLEIIKFPQEATALFSCRRAISRFRIALAQSFGYLPEIQVKNYSPQDTRAIRYASSFALSCTVLYNQMINGNKCESSHQARLHLSGFRNGQLLMEIDTCQGLAGMSAVFAPTRAGSSQAHSSTMPSEVYRICSSELPQVNGSNFLCVAFNSSGMWTLTHDGDLAHLTPPLSGQKTVEHLLARESGFTSKHQKIFGILLAASMFQLYDSPWIEQGLASERIFLPLPDNLHRKPWFPQILTTLVRMDSRNFCSDNIAALGILILELEAGRHAEWPDEYEISGPWSTHVRLAQLLKSWEDVVSDDYRAVARACLEFESLAACGPHPNLISDLKRHAIFYKYILEPLFHHGVRCFKDIRSVFYGIFALEHHFYRSARFSGIKTLVKEHVLFDDDDDNDVEDVPLRTAARNSAVKFLDGLAGFFQGINDLEENSISSTGPRSSKKIRIAVLDSGVDGADSLIRSGIKYKHIDVDKSKSFVGDVSEWKQDTYGHGTWVTQLLLKTARAAELSIGKICHNKFLDNESMVGIAKAIDWAVEECHADIISMSFGFENVDDRIDEALEKALKAGKLIIAAASNNGGISGRTRPACKPGILCIHATDGKVNKGTMNPSPLPKCYNFATLGVEVPVKWKGDELRKSGTSFAVPIAAGFAADVLEFAQHKCINLKPWRLELLFQNRGMWEIFKKMSEERDGYDFLHPGRLFKDWPVAEGSEEQAVKDIEEILKYL